MMLFPPLSMPSLVVPLRPLPAILRNLLQGLLYVQTRTLKGEARFRAHVSLMLTSLDRYFTYAAGSRLFRQVPTESFRFGSALVPQCWLCLVVAGGGGARERERVCVRARVSVTLDDGIVGIAPLGGVTGRHSFHSNRVPACQEYVDRATEKGRERETLGTCSLTEGLQDERDMHDMPT